MLEVGDVVRIKEDIQHDHGYAGTFGIICHNYLADYYYVFAWNKAKKRFWECGFKEENLESQGYKIMPMLIELQHWMNSQHSLKSGMKLKPKKFGKHYEYWKIRKEKGIEKAKK